MKLINILIGILCLTIILSSCQKDKVEEPEKYYINAKVNFTDAESLPKKHKLSLQLFVNEKDKFPEIEFDLDTKNIVNTLEIKQEIDTSHFGTYIAKLSIVESAVRRIELINYGKITIDGSFNLTEKEVAIASLSRLKLNLFNRCAGCHGKNPVRIAAKLNLLPDSIYSNLVNQKSKNSKLLRVKPFEPQSSFIVSVLNQDGISFTHEASTNIWAIQKELLENWIKEGAKED